ncbi:hypothetical protein SAMD00019534_083880 [Acytostelium subglobosum LB1]|uniref:hypothetical protein n=1 Tax=Acytostelium subglobosum LB1 TaxID=1410327 RepID=UPI0006450DD2|nr:hypothetical protein SAMD00019534_083880 [Acytostelium subglobosum LB1]GAM25213.1 hypothetical protein SAMD00019534_083880 [Acytostelium subglobosum LB1]|eukprot:XP_012751733.1 hypothetical protein SAMD00019534_083880 [Acytostelium subglobosum LB1]
MLSLNFIVGELLNQYVKIKESHVILFDFITKHPKYTYELLINQQRQQHTIHKVGSPPTSSTIRPSSSSSLSSIGNEQSSLTSRNTDNINNNNVHTCPGNEEELPTNDNNDNKEESPVNRQSIEPSLELHAPQEHQQVDAPSGNNDNDNDNNTDQQPGSQIEPMSSPDIINISSTIDEASQRSQPPASIKQVALMSTQSQYTLPPQPFDWTTPPDDGTSHQLIGEYQSLKKDFEHILNSNEEHVNKLNELCTMFLKHFADEQQRHGHLPVVEHDEVMQEEQPKHHEYDNINQDTIIDMELLEEISKSRGHAGADSNKNTNTHNDDDQTIDVDQLSGTLAMNVEKLLVVNTNFQYILDQFRDNISQLSSSMEANTKLNKCCALVEHLIDRLKINGSDFASIYSALELKLVQLTTTTITTTTTMMSASLSSRGFDDHNDSNESIELQLDDEVQAKIANLEQENKTLKDLDNQRNLVIEKLTTTLDYFTQKQKDEMPESEEEISSQRQVVDAERQRFIDRIKELELENAELASTNHQNILQAENEKLNECVHRLEDNNKHLVGQVEELKQQVNVLEVVRQQEPESETEAREPEPENDNEPEQPRPTDSSLERSFPDRSIDDIEMADMPTQPPAVDGYERMYMEALHLFNIENNNNNNNVGQSLHGALLDKIRTMFETNIRQSNELDSFRTVVTELQTDKMRSTEDRERQIELLLKERELMRSAKQALEDKITTMNQEINDASYNLISQQESCNALAQRLTEHRQQVDEKEHQLREMERSVDELNRRLLNAATKSEEDQLVHDHAVETLKEKNVKMEQIIEKLEENIKTKDLAASRRASQLEDQLQIANNRCAVLESERQVEQERAKSLTSNSDQITQLRAMMADLNESKKQLQIEHDNMADKMHALDERVKEQDEEIEHLIKQKTDSQLQIAPLKEEVDSSKQMLETLLNDYTSIKTLYHEKTEELEHLNKKYQANKTAAADAKTRADSLENELKTCNDRLDQCNEQLQSSALNLQSTTETLKLTTETLTKKERSFEEAKAEHTRMRKELGEAKALIDMLQSESSQQSNVYKRQQDELKQAALDSNSKLMDYMRETTEYKPMYEQLCIANDDLTMRCDNLTQEKSRLMSALEQLKIVKESSGGPTKDVELRTARKEIEYLKAEIDKMTREKAAVAQPQTPALPQRPVQLLLLPQFQPPAQPQLPIQPQAVQQQPPQQALTLPKPALPRLKLKVPALPSLSNGAPPTTSSSSLATKKRPLDVVEPTVTSSPSSSSSSLADANKKQRTGVNGGTSASSSASANASASASTSASATTNIKPFVLFTNFKDESEKAELIQKAEILGCNVRKTHEFDRAITHVVTASTKHTMKTVSAALTHKWILSKQWILDSVKEGHIVSELEYGKKYDATPFLNKKFLVTDSFVASNKVSKQSILSLIKSLGKGEIVEEEQQADHILVGPEFKNINKQHMTWSGFISLATDK